MPDHIERHVPPLLLSSREGKLKRLVAVAGEGVLFAIASLSVFAVLFIFYFIARDALFSEELKSNGEMGLKLIMSWDLLSQFLTGSQWYPTHSPEIFGALSIFYGSLMVTIGACVVAVPLGICSSLALSDILPFSWRQTVKPVIELLASIPSVAYGFFALVVFAPALQNHGGFMLKAGAWMAGLPLFIILSLVIGGLIGDCAGRPSLKYYLSIACFMPLLALLYFIGEWFGGFTITSGTNALNVSIILGIMALPTIVSVSEDALQAVGPELRMGSYGLGATRAETLILTVVPAASSGICAAIILGIMRALGETMVVWMAAGNAAVIPSPFYNFLSPVRTMTATIAGEMGETARNTPHYSILFLMALCLLLFCFVCNLASEWVMKRNRARLRGER